MTRDEYHAILFADEIAADARERRSLLLLRALLLVLAVGVAGVLAPPTLLALLFVPGHCMRYRRRLERGRLLLHL